MRVHVPILALAIACCAASLGAQDAAKSVAATARIYKFSAIYSAKKIIEGVLTDYSDSLVVTSEWARCKPQDPKPDSATYARFKCSGVDDVEGLSLSFERAAPTHATWTGIPKRMSFKVVAICSSAVNCRSSSDMPAGPPSRGVPTVTEKLKVSEKK